MVEKKSFLSRINSFIIAVGNKISWIYLFIVLISVYEVVMRYAFNKPTIWVHETSLSLAAIVMVYGGLYAYAKNKHITVSVVVDLLPKKMQKIFEVIADFFGFAYILLLTISALMITYLAVFSPDGRIRLERSGSSWNSLFPSIIKISMSTFLLLFLILITVTMIFRCKALIKKEDSKNV